MQNQTTTGLKDRALSEKQLTPDRHPQTELFLCDISDAIIKDDMAMMEHPIFSLSKKPDTTVRRYEDRKGNFLEIKPGSGGLATIYDKEILVFAISQLVAAKNAGRLISNYVEFDAKDFLIFSNRHTGGKDYRALEAALSRLDETRLRTNIRRGDEDEWQAFGLIEGAIIKRKSLDGAVLSWGVKLSDWTMKAIESNNVLTLNRDYFRLSRPLERRVYEIARKHCGRKKNGWRIGLDTLQNKCGSTSQKRHFKRLIRRMVEYDHLPDYSVSFDDDTNMVFFFPRAEFIEAISQSGDGFKIPALKEATIKTFRKKWPGKDVYHYEAEWRHWASTKPDAPDNPDGAFLAFATKRMMAEAAEG